MREIGRAVSEEELKSNINWKEGNLLDFARKRIISMNELYTPKMKTTLDWENLGEIRRRNLGGEIVFPRIGGFKELMAHLIYPLEKAGEFSYSFKEGYHSFLNSDYGEGIEIHIGSVHEFRKGKTDFISLNCYPKRIEDAKGYLEKTLKHSGYIAEIKEKISKRNIYATPIN